MKLQSQSSRALNAALQKASKCVSSKSVMAILENVLLSQKEDGRFFFTTATGESQLVIPAPVSLVDGTFSTPVALPIRSISALLGTLPDCAVVFDFDEDTQGFSLVYCSEVNGQTKSGKVSLPYFKGDEFPTILSPDAGGTHIVLPAEKFGSIVKDANDFVARDDLRPILSCLCIDIADDLSEVAFVATNGHVLMKVIHTNNSATGGSDFFRGGKADKILFHMQFFRTLSVFDGCDLIDIESDGRMIRFSSGDIEFVCKCFEGRFPNYNGVIPKGNPFSVCFDKKEMLETIKRVSLFVNNNVRLVALRKDGLFLNVSTRDIDMSMAADDQVLISDAACEDGFRIGCNVQSLLATIGDIPSDMIRMSLSEPSRPAVFTANEPSPQVLTLCMPMLLDS